jgi:hypothetical protein
MNTTGVVYKHVTEDLSLHEQHYRAHVSTLVRMSIYKYIQAIFLLLLFFLIFFFNKDRNVIRYRWVTPKITHYSKVDP